MAEAERPSIESVDARTAILDAAGRGDLEPARLGWEHRDWRVRATSLRTLCESDAVGDAILAQALADSAPGVRRVLAELGATRPSIDLTPLLGDDDARVVEVACWAAGERGDAGAAHVPALSDIGREHDDPLCREAAIAALGAIGHADGPARIVARPTDRPAVRRRAVLALAPFEGPEVSAALDRALTDRDWQVRQAAEDLLGP